MPSKLLILIITQIVFFCRFAKNVSADSVNVSTLKGEGELTNLELNETVLTDLLELPTWLRIARAQVNRVNLKIQWTKLKNVPILVVSSFIVAISIFLMQGSYPISV